MVKKLINWDVEAVGNPNQASDYYVDDTETTNNNLWSSNQTATYVTEQLLNVPTLPAVAVATTANVTLSGLQTIDTYVLQANDYILVKNQTISGQNGPYRVPASGAWVRQVFNTTTKAYEDITTQTTYEELNINGGVVNVINGTTNKNLQFQFFISIPTGLIASNGSNVLVSAVTKLPIASSTNRFVDCNFGNDTNNNGSSAFPFATISRALTGMQFPGSITLAASGGSYTGAITWTSGQSNVTVQSQNTNIEGGQSSINAQHTFASGNTRVDFKATTHSTGTTAPFSFASGAACRNLFQDITVNSTNADWLGLNAGCTNWVTLNNIIFGAALVNAVNLPAFSNAFTINVQNQNASNVLRFTGTGAANTIINIQNCTDGLVWIPSTFLGTINFTNSAWGNILGSPLFLSGVVNNQTDLTTILSHTANSNYDGWYLINFASPTSFARNAIFGKYTVGGVTFTFWGRNPASAPASVTNALGETYVRNGAGYTQPGTVAAQYLKYSRVTPQSGLGDNTQILFDTLEASIGSNISINTGTGTITLQPGFTYRLRAGVTFVTSSGSPANLQYMWRNNTTSTLIGNKTWNLATSFTTNNGVYMGTAEAVITPAVATEVSVIVTNLSDVTSINAAISPAWCEVEAISSTVAIGTTVITTTTNISATTTAPTKGTGITSDKITLIDDGSGYCQVIMNLSWNTSAGTAGNGDYTVLLPGGYQFDTTAQPVSTQTQFPTNNNYADMGKLIPATGSLTSFNTTTVNAPVVAIVPAPSTRFKVVAPPNFDANVPRYWGSTWYQWTFNLSTFQLSFTFKKA